MVSNLSKLKEVNVLANEAKWAWPEALCDIFRPRGVNLLIAKNAGEFVSIIETVEQIVHPVRNFFGVSNGVNKKV